MRRRFWVGLVLGLWVMGSFGLANAQSIVLLEDYQITNSVDDIVHLGDQPNVPGFIVPGAQGDTITFEFDAPSELTLTDLSLSISHYEVSKDYYDEVLINGVEIGILSDSPEHWLTEQFRIPAGTLQETGNTLTINAFRKGSNFDDFEFTNLKVSAALQADAGPDQIICNALCDEVILDGRKSMDDIMEIVSHEWEVIHRSDPAYNQSASGETPVISNLEPGVYDVTLTVTNTVGLTATDVMELSVQATCNPCSILKGDLDSDGDVDGDDLKIFSQNYGSFPLAPSP